MMSGEESLEDKRESSDKQIQIGNPANNGNLVYRNNRKS